MKCPYQRVAGGGGFPASPFPLPAGCSSRHAWPAPRAPGRGCPSPGALHHHPLPLAEQVRQYPLIAHRHRPFGVVEAEVHLQRVRVAPDAAGHHHPADAQALAHRRQLLRLALAVEDFAGGIEQVDIRAQRVQDRAVVSASPPAPRRPPIAGFYVAGSRGLLLRLCGTHPRLARPLLRHAAQNGPALQHRVQRQQRQRRHGHRHRQPDKRRTRPWRKIAPR